jgi:hypothetical protein
VYELKVVNIDTRFEIYNDSLQVYDRLPAKTYTVCFTKMSGFYLEAHADLKINEKIYGVHEEKAWKVLRSFAGFDRSLGVILSGDKGIGKSLFAKRLCEMAVDQGIPVLIVDQFIPGVASYIESIDQEVLVLFDEFDKTFGNIRVGENEADPQAGLLSLFDGVAHGKKLFVITCNELRKLNDYLVNRPGRFHYHFRFDYPSDAEIKEYLTDKLHDAYYGEIEKVVAFSKRINLNYDCLRAIAFELNTGEPFETAIQDLNILNLNQEQYRITCHFTDGTTLMNRRVGLDLFDGEFTREIELYDHKNNNICDVRVNTEDAVYDTSREMTVVPGANCKFTYWYDEASEDLKQKQVDYLSIVHIYEKSLHYASAI